MKRSEVLLKLTKIIQLIRQHKTSPEYEASTILDSIEKLGMLPPFIDQSDITSDEYFVLHVDEVAYPGVCEWEEEG